MKRSPKASIPANDVAARKAALKAQCAAAIDDLRCVHAGSIRFDGVRADTAPYAAATLFDPYVLRSGAGAVTVGLPADESTPLSRRSQRERVRFESGRVGERVLHNMFPFIPERFGPDWKTLAHIAELPGAVVRPGKVRFVFDPYRLIREYLDEMDPDITADLIDLTVRGILAARGCDRETDSEDLRRDFHALGVSAFLIARLFRMRNEKWSPEEIMTPLARAAESYQPGGADLCREALTECFRFLERSRKQIVSAPVSFLHMPHGGILFRDEGFAEYDWPEAAAQVLRMYLGWCRRFGYAMAPDIGAGTLKHLNETHPQTIAELRAAWSEGLIEFVNGTWGQPYLQLWDMWDQKQQFAKGLEVFEDLFGRRPSVYAAQEIALHPGLPALLNEFGYKCAIHRSQNLGLTRIEPRGLIEWVGADGSSITALPAHAPRTERLGEMEYERLPEILSAGADADLDFIAVTSLIDQTFIGACQEEVVRAGRYSGVWGPFVTPSRFFEELSGSPRPRVQYRLDDYDYHPAMPPSNYHRYESGGFSSTLGWLRMKSRELQAAEARGDRREAELERLLDGQAHDAYILPYFKTGSFMELYLPDYRGPRYQVTSDVPRGVERFIRDAVSLPVHFEDLPPCEPEEAKWDAWSGECGGLRVVLDPKRGAVVQLGEWRGSLGAIVCGKKSLTRVHGEPKGSEWIGNGRLSGFGSVGLRYFFSGGRLYCVISADASHVSWDCRQSYWEGVRIAHRPAGEYTISRTVSGVCEPTTLDEFFCPGAMEVTTGNSVLELEHGGNIFFRRTSGGIENRLWCYNEFARAFWWSVRLKALS